MSASLSARPHHMGDFYIMHLGGCNALKLVAVWWLSEAACNVYGWDESAVSRLICIWKREKYGDDGRRENKILSFKVKGEKKWSKK